MSAAVTRRVKTDNSKGQTYAQQASHHTGARQASNHTGARQASHHTGARQASAGQQARSDKLSLFRQEFYKTAQDAEWQDWRWQLRQSLRSSEEIARIFALSADEKAGLQKAGNRLPLAITPYYAGLMDRQDALNPLRRTHLPVMNEFLRAPYELQDPLGEDKDMKAPGLVHRYPDRVLFLLTSRCATYCRYCLRARLVGNNDYRLDVSQWEAALDYIAATKTVRDVLLSGGDPLLLSDRKLDWLLSRLRAIPHVEFIRIGTKIPAVLPQRITANLCRILRKHLPWLSLHLTHPDEFTAELALALHALADAGLPLGGQTVLLRGVNDDVATLKSLFHQMLACRVRPYYLLQLDPIAGSAHFKVPITKGLELIAALRGHTSGYAVPDYIIDCPNGGGKIELVPEALLGRSKNGLGDEWLIRNYAGEIYHYPDPISPAEKMAKTALEIVPEALSGHHVS